MASRKKTDPEIEHSNMINDLADRIYSILKRKEVSVKDLNKILYRVRETAANNTKL